MTTTPRSVARDAAHVVRSIAYRSADTLNGRLTKPLHGWEAVYDIDPQHPALEPFQATINTRKAHRRARIHGRHEPAVQTQLARQLTDTSVFWEIGSYRGYHTLSIAPHIDEALCVDARACALNTLREDAYRNNYTNINTQQAILGHEISLDDLCATYPTPDLILMDIEGWEHDVLQESNAIWRTAPTLIIEVHDESGWIDGHVTTPTGQQEDRPSPEKYGKAHVERLLRDFGYTVTVIGQRRPSNCHILATPNGGTDR